MTLITNQSLIEW